MFSADGQFMYTVGGDDAARGFGLLRPGWKGASGFCWPEEKKDEAPRCLGQPRRGGVLRISPSGLGLVEDFGVSDISSSLGL